MSLLAKVYVIDNTYSQKYFKEIESNEKLKRMFINLVNDAKKDYNMYQAKQMLKTDYDNKLKL